MRAAHQDVIIACKMALVLLQKQAQYSNLQLTSCGHLWPPCQPASKQPSANFIS